MIQNPRPPLNPKKERPHPVAAHAIDRPSTACKALFRIPPVSPKASMKPTAMMAATLPNLSHGPVREFRIWSRGPSQGMPLPAAKSTDGARTIAAVTIERTLISNLLIPIGQPHYIVNNIHLVNAIYFITSCYIDLYKVIFSNLLDTDLKTLKKLIEYSVLELTYIDLFCISSLNLMKYK